MTTEDSFAGAGSAPQPQNAANQTQVTASAKMREWLDDQDSGDLRKVLSTAEGRRFVLRVLAEGRLGVSPFATDSIQMAHNVGQQELGRIVIEWIQKLGPDVYPKLLMQRSEELKQNDIARQRILDGEKERNRSP